MKDELDKKFKEYIGTLTSAENKNPYSPYDLEYLITSVSKILNRLIDLRTQYENIEAKNQVTFQKFALLRNTNPGDREIDLSSVDEDNKLVKTKWTSIDTHLGKLLNLHGETGNPLNYEERAKRLRSMINEEMNTLFHKCHSLYLGMKHVYQVSPVDRYANIPNEINTTNPDAIDLIDVFVFWTRKIIFAYEEQLANYDRFDVTYSFMQTRKLSNKPSTTGPNKELTKLAKLIDGGKIILDLSKQFPEDYFENVRVKGVSVSVGLWPTREHTYKNNVPSPGIEYCSVRGLLFPPEQKNLFNKETGGSATDSQPPIFMDKTTMPSPNGETKYHRSKRTENLDPAGKWIFMISDFIFNSGYEYHNPAYRKKFSNDKKAPWINDIKLHLKVEAKYKTKEQDKWNEYHSKIDVREEINASQK